MRRPLDEQLNQNATSYFLYVNLGSNATEAAQTAAQTACRALSGTCSPTGNNGHFPAYYAVQLLFPKKDYSLWQKVMGGAS